MKYNGHKNWNCWNVSLWLNNDEGLYRKYRSLIARHTRKQAAELMLSALNECGIYETPDGAKYTKTAILLAMRG